MPPVALRATVVERSRPASSSAARPISGACTPSRPRVDDRCRGAPRPRRAVTRSAFPLRSNAAGGPTRTAARPARIVADRRRGPCPARPCDCTRAAVLTASPSAAYSTRLPAPIAPTTTGPVWTPTRTPNPSTSHPRSTSRAYSRSRRTIRRAARTARSGSSSCAVGAPNSASTPSPARSLIVPPNDLDRADHARRSASPTISFSSSGSRRSASAVEPTRSANTAVTTRRSSRTRGPSGPHGGYSPDLPGDRASTSSASAWPRRSIASRSARRSSHAGGIAARPWRAPSRAPATAAFVSVSPPSPTT